MDEKELYRRVELYKKRKLYEKSSSYKKKISYKKKRKYNILISICFIVFIEGIFIINLFKYIEVYAALRYNSYIKLCIVLLFAESKIGTKYITMTI